jgi:hypothetical protein
MMNDETGERWNDEKPKYPTKSEWINFEGSGFGILEFVILSMLG